MGGNALKKYGIETERKSTIEFYRIGETLSKLVENKLGLETFITKFYRNKKDHGDLDLLIRTDGNVDILKFIKDEIGTENINANGGVYSFEYENFQVDFILISKEHFETSKVFFSYDPVGNLLGKFAYRFGLKYGNKGLVYPFRNFDGRVVDDIVISKDIPKIYEFLGVDYEQFQDGFNDIEDIFKFIINSKYFNPLYFQMENLTSIDRKRNKKRKTFKEFLDYVNNRKFENPYIFKSRDQYIDYVDTYFPEAKLKEKLEILKKKDEENKIISEKFNGNLVMEIFPELVGKELGAMLGEFKGSFENYREYILTNSSEQILTDFKNFYHGKK